MTETIDTDLVDLLDTGNVRDYVEKRLFNGKIDSLNQHIERKKALAEPTRYSILYLLYEYGQVSRKRLAEETGRDSNKLQHHLEDLLDTNLIATIPAPDDADGRKTYYRITTLGKQEIASDIEHIVGGHAHKTRHEALADPELVDATPTDSDRQRPLADTNETDTEELNHRRRGLQEQWENFQTATANQD